MKYLFVFSIGLLLVSCGEQALPSSSLLCDCADNSLKTFDSKFIEKLTETARTTGDFHDTILKLTDNNPGILVPIVEQFKSKWEKGVEQIITDYNLTDEQFEKYVQASTNECPEQMLILTYFFK